MRMRQYICHTDHNLWDVNVNGDLEEESAPTGETSAPPAPKTAKQLAAKRNQERVKSILLLAIPDEYLLKFHNVPDAKSLWDEESAPTGDKEETLLLLAPKDAKIKMAAKRNQERVKSILLLAIPDEYLLKFHNVPDAKSLWAAIKSRFGGNEESKKMQKNVHGDPISKEDINQKFLRSLHPSWNQIALIMRNKPDIDEIDIYDLYNNLRVYEDEIKSSLSSTSNSQNLAFLSSENTSSTNEVSTANGDFRIDEDDLEELDLRWQVGLTAGLVIGGLISAEWSQVQEERVKKFIQKSGRNLDFKEKRHVSFDKSKVECYNCHRKGHFARECRSGRNQGRRSYGDNGRSNAPTNESSSQALLAQDGLGDYDWSNDFEVEPVNYALMAISFSSSSSSSDNEVQKCSKQCLESFKTLQKNYDSEREKHNKARLEIQGYEIALESLESKILGHEKNELAWGEKYEFQNYELKCREIKINNLNLELEKVVKERDELNLKIVKWEESSKNLNELLNSQMSARDKTGLGYGTQLNEMSNISETDRNFLTPRVDISFAGLDEYAIRKKIIESTELNTKTSETVVGESVVSNPKINRDRVITEDWNSDDEDDASKVQTVSHVKTNETQTVKSRVDKFGQTSQKQGIGFKKIKACFVKNMTTAETRAIVNTGKGKMDTDLKKSRWVWRPKGTYLDHVSKDSGSFMLKKFEYGNPKILLQDHAVVDSGCSSHMTGNKAYLSDYEDYNGGFVAFRSDPKGGKNNSLDLKNIVPSRGITCLYANAIADESKLWQRRLDLVRCDNGTEFKNHVMNDFCAKKGIKREFSVARTPQQNGVAKRKNTTLIEAARTMLADSLLPISFWAEAVNTACYVLNRVLVTKPQNKTSYELLIGKFDGKSDEDQPNMAGTGPDWMFDLDFLTNTMNYIPVSVENQVTMDAGIQDSYVAGTDKESTQEYILLPIHPHGTRIPVEDVVQAAQEKPSENASQDKDVQDSEDTADKEEQHQMKESEQVLQDELEKMVTQELAAKAMDDVSRQAFEEEKRRIASQKKAAQATSTNQLSTDRPFVSTDRSFVSTDRSNTPNVSAASTSTGANADESSFVYLGGKIPIDASTLPNADLPIDPNMPDLEDASDTLPNDGIFNGAYDDDEDVGAVADFNNMDNIIAVSPIPTLRIHKDHLKGQILRDPTSANRTNHKDHQNCLFACFLSQEEPKTISQALQDESWVEAMQEELLQFKLQKVWVLVDLPYGKKVIGTKWVFRNKRDERSIVVKNKARLVAQGFRQEEGIDYDEVFAPVARIEAIRLFLAFASYMGFTVYQMDVKSAFLYDTIKEEVYVHQPPGFIDPAHPNKVYKVIKALYGLHQAPRAYSNYTEFEDCIYKRFQITPWVSSHPFWDCRSMIGSLMYLTASRPDIMFAVCACARFQVTPKASHLNAVKRIFRYLKHQPKLGLWYPRDSPFELEAFSDSDYGGASLDRKSTTVKNPVYHSRTKHIEIRHHFIRDCYEKRLVDVIKIHIDANVADLLNKGFDVTRFNFLVLELILIRTSMNLRMDGSCASSLSHIWSMANLRYSDKHNMVAFLKKPTESVGFTEIVDFLKVLQNPATVRTLANGIQELVASIDNKEYTITEASIRSQLQLADATGITNLPDAEIYEGLATLGGFAGEHVPLLPAMLAGAAPDQADEATTTCVGVKTERATTTTYGLDAGMNSGNIHESLLRSHEAPFPKGNTSRSAEDSLNLKELMDIVPKLVLRIDNLEKELQQTKSTYGKADEETEDQGRKIQDIDDDPLVSLVRNSMEEKEANFVTPKKNVSTYKRRARSTSKGKDIGIGMDFFSAAKERLNSAKVEVNTKVNPGSVGVNTGNTPVSTPIVIQTVNVIVPSLVKSQREGKAPMTSEYVQTTQKTKEYIRQEEVGLAEAMRFQALQDEEDARQVHLDALLAKRIQEEQELSEQQQKRKAKVQEAAQFYTEEDWDTIRAKLEANAELTKSLQGENVSSDDFAKRMVDMINQKKKYYAEQKAKAKRDKPMTQAQQRDYMSTFIKNQSSWKMAQLKKLTFEELKVEFEKLMRSIESFVPMGSEERVKRAGVQLEQESSKKQKIVVKDVPVAPERKRKRKKQKARKGTHADKTAKHEAEEDMEALVKGNDTNSSSDPIWNLPYQQKMLRWRYYDTCRVNCLTLELADIYMLTERRYPIPADVCQAMLDKKLKGSKDEACYQLLKLIEKQTQNKLP
ncbi:putative ribonuclease H-like domain-containing protein [Tanacetum coccineum]|uniref:Ribonuclease H-like domain-containing protein n=1 Tax=Tanacetum coccineum TaxID=301880 RepID=A0ABQ5CC59_9ASTR